jgi:TIR domain.
MSESPTYDVFISHSSKDKAVVRELAERLKADGLRVWFDDWVIQPGDMIGLKIEQGLEQSRTLVLVMSANAFASEWVTLERHTAMFRDPTNQERRFIPLLIDNTQIKDTLKQFAYVDWRHRSDEQYAKLLAACRPPIVAVEPDRAEAQTATKQSTHRTYRFGVWSGSDGRRTACRIWLRRQHRASVGYREWQMYRHTQRAYLIFEARVLAGNLDYQKSENQRMDRLPHDEEQIVLRAMHQILVDHSLCLREHTEGRKMALAIRR